MRRIVLSKPSAVSRGWVCAFCTVPVLAIVAIALLVFPPASRHNASVTTAAGSRAPLPQPATPAARGRIQASYAALPLAFEQNKGQTDAQVKYMARGNGYTLFLTASDAVFALRSPSAESKTSTVRPGTELRAKNAPKHQEHSTAVVRMQLAGGNSLAKVSAGGQLPGKSNYFIGNDPSKWQTDVAHYARVSYQDVYPGVNLAYHGVQRQAEFDFVVAPGANPEPIGFHFTGAQRIKTDDSGNLVISSAAGDVLLHKPVAYQEQNGARQLVDAQFILKANNQVSFELGNYDHRHELVIDPSVSYAYSTYLGGSGNDEGYGIAFDSSGNAYVTGQTASQNFPGTSGGFTGTAQAFVTKIAADGSSLVYSTYVGGSGNPGDSGNAIAVNQTTGDAYIAGGTTSSNFPTTTGAFQTKLGTGAAGNAFVLELSSNGGTLTYSTYLGGTGDDKAYGIALDASGNVYVVGGTSSTNFPTLNPVQTHVTGSTGSGFLTELNSSGSALVYSTYIGGSSVGLGDLADAVALDSSDNAYVTGQTFSATFHTTTGAAQTTCGSCTNSDSNAFVTVVNANGSGYVYSTFLGGNGIDSGSGIAVDSTGNAYVTGTTTSTNFPTTTGALQTAFGSGASDAFITKINPAGSAFVYSTYLGGGGANTASGGEGIAIDGSSNAYVTGTTTSSSFPTVNPTQLQYGGDTDAFVSEINSAGSALVFSTYLGGSGPEDFPPDGAIAVDSAGDIYVTGNTAPPPVGSNNFPVQSAEQSNPGGGTDAFVVEYTQGANPTFSLSATALSPSSVSPGGSATSTVTVTPAGGFSGTVALACAVVGPTGAIHLPTCGAASATSAAPGTLTVNTTAATALLLPAPNSRPSGLFYAMFLPVGAVALLSFGSTGPRRKKMFGFLLLGLMVSGLFLMPACSSSSGGGGGGGSPGTTAGSYTITVTGTSSGATETGTSPSLTLTVN
jgi:Beta-propeller repeat